MPQEKSRNNAGAGAITYALVASGHRILLLSTQTGEGLGQASCMNSDSFVFSPDGKTLASGSQAGIILWDATNGQVKEPPFHVGENLTNLQWCDNRYLMTRGRLIDTELKTVAWIYHSGCPGCGQTLGGLFWYAMGLRRNWDTPPDVPAAIKVQGVPLPHPEAIRELETDSSRFIVAPGTPVALVLDPSVQNERAAVQKSMEDKFRENGWVLANNAPITVTLTVVLEPERTTSYRGFGGGNTVVKYQPRVSQLDIRDGDTLVWSQSNRRDIPLMFQTRGNASMQDVVDQYMNSYNYAEWFQNLRLPKTIFDPAKAGQSRLTENGVE